MQSNRFLVEVLYDVSVPESQPEYVTVVEGREGIDEIAIRERDLFGAAVTIRSVRLDPPHSLSDKLVGQIHYRMRSSRPANYRERATWGSMLRRCYVEDCPEYKYYGGRGVRVCDRWRESFEAFLEDMGECPPMYSLDRIDNDGDYCKENCRWASRSQQANNKSTNVRLEFEGRTQTASQWAYEKGLSPATVLARLRNGWSVERTLTEPTRVYKRRTEVDSDAD